MGVSGRIAIVGGGAMGSALLKGLLENGVVEASQVTVAEVDAQRAAGLREQYQVETVSSPAELQGAGLLILAVKPADAPSAAREAAAGLSPEGLVISLAAGVRTAILARVLPQGQPLVRAMPNTPALIGQGAAALAAGEFASPEHMALARRVFEAVGQVVETPEKLMDAVTGLSGSGPAYVFLFIEALADAGVAQGLNRADSLALAAATTAGAAELLISSGDHPAKLKDMVTSPGGTTIAGLHVLENGGFKGLIMDAVAAATRRSKELGGD